MPKCMVVSMAGTQLRASRYVTVKRVYPSTPNLTTRVAPLRPRIRERAQRSSRGCVWPPKTRRLASAGVKSTKSSAQMAIDWQSFTPMSALAGGALIGAAAVAFIHVNGRIAGISGIVGGIVRRQRGDVGWRAAFVAGVLAAPVLFRLLSILPPIRIDAAYPLLALAGLLVGSGTRLGSGCTSGHGVCGLSRMSPRSFAATLTFMAAGFLTVFFVRHVLG